MNNPLVSIIVPCYNQAEYLADSLGSVLKQTYTNWECIIINDGSPDNTEEVAGFWLNKNERFKYLSIKNGGLSNARNVGINNANGIYILPLDADDKIGEKYLELAINQFKKKKDLKLVYCKAKKFGAIEKDWNLPAYSLENLAKGNIIFCTALFKKADWNRVNGYDKKMIYGYEDWEFWISILKNGGDVIQLPETLFYYRVKKESMFKKIDSKKRKYLFDYLSIKHASFYITHLGNFIELEKTVQLRKKEIAYLKKSKKQAFINLLKSILGSN